MKYVLSEKYDTPYYMSKIMGPNPLKLEETRRDPPRGTTASAISEADGG